VYEDLVASCFEPKMIYRQEEKTSTTTKCGIWLHPSPHLYKIQPQITAPELSVFFRCRIMSQARRAEVHTQLAGRCPDPWIARVADGYAASHYFTSCLQMNTVTFRDGIMNEKSYPTTYRQWNSFL